MASPKFEKTPLDDIEEVPYDDKANDTTYTGLRLPMPGNDSMIEEQEEEDEEYDSECDHEDC